MTKEEIKSIIDEDNGVGFSDNINLNGYVFTKNRSFIVFEFKTIEEILVCHVKYIHYENKKDFMTILVNCCNFWMGNKVQFIFYKEKQRTKNSAVKELKDLNFRIDIIQNPVWKFPFKCKLCKTNPDCTCVLYSLYK